MSNRNGAILGIKISSLIYVEDILERTPLPFTNVWSYHLESHHIVELKV